MRAFALFAACFCFDFLASAKAPFLHETGSVPDETLEVRFVSRDVGWCRTTDGLYRTTDAGKHWSPVKGPPGDGYNHIWQFQFLDPDTGWVRTTLGPLFWTHDAGRTWVETPTPFTSGAVPSRGLVEDVRFASTKIGWLLALREVPGDPLSLIRYRMAGEHSVYVPVLFRTMDGGHTWIEAPYPDLKGMPDRLEFADAIHGISIELNATLYTRDGGQSWHKSRYCADVDTTRLRRAWPGTGMFAATTAQLLDASLGLWSVEGDLFRTSDGGATWRRLPPIRWHKKSLRIGEIRFVNQRLGWALPPIDEELAHPTPAPCFQTEDGGETWVAVGMPDDACIEGMTVTKDGTVYVWGDRQLYLIVV